MPIAVSVDPLMQRRWPSEADQGTDLMVESLYRQHSLRLTRLAAAIVLDREVAQEVMQDAFVGLQRRWSSIENPAGYLQRSVVNLSIKALRRRKVAARYPVSAAPVIQNPEIDETWLAVGKLNPRQRSVVLLRYWEDMSESDIAETLGWRAGTVKSNLHRALALLRKDLEQ